MKRLWTILPTRTTGRKCKPGILLLLMMAVAVMGCSSDDELPETIEPEFNNYMGTNPITSYEKTSTQENGVEVTRNAQGGITFIAFGKGTTPPATATDLIQQYIKPRTEDEYRLYRKEDYQFAPEPLGVECYQQFYKGVLVYDIGYNVQFKSGKIISATGSFLKIDQLNTVPSISVQKAKEVYANYLGTTVNAISDKGIDNWFDDLLMIMEFPLSKDSEEWGPRLVYGFYFNGMSKDGTGIVDAQTGRLLRTWPNYIP